MKQIKWRSLMAGMLFMPAIAWSGGWMPDASRGWGDFAQGAAVGIVAHEAGHLAVAAGKGYPVSHDGLSITYPGVQFTPAAQLQLASAGYQVQWLLSEWALRDRDGREGKTPRTDFEAGMVVSALGVSLAYLTFLKDQYNGDVYGISRATGYSHDQVALAMAIPAALDAWRLFGDDVPKWVPVLSVAGKGMGVAWIWRD